LTGLTYPGEVLLPDLRSRLIPGGMARADGLKAASDTFIPSGCLRFPGVSNPTPSEACVAEANVASGTAARLSCIPSAKQLAY
jgi:hypothetical protein